MIIGIITLVLVILAGIGLYIWSESEDFVKELEKRNGRERQD